MTAVAASSCQRYLSPRFVKSRTAAIAPIRTMSNQSVHSIEFVKAGSDFMLLADGLIPSVVFDFFFCRTRPITQHPPSVLLPVYATRQKGRPYVVEHPNHYI